MTADITENIGKTKKCLTLRFLRNKEVVQHLKFEGDRIIEELASFCKQNKSLINETNKVTIYAKNLPFEYVQIFKNINTLHISTAYPLKFPDLKNLNTLSSVHINQLNKPTDLKNLSTIKNLKELYIGDFTFNAPIRIDNFDEIIQCKKLEKIFLSNAKFDEAELKRITALKSLKDFTVNQRIETDTLAYLAAKLPYVRSNELKAWQSCTTSWGDVKINGKRKPYLFKDKDQEKIKKYEAQFEALKNKYLN